MFAGELINPVISPLKLSDTVQKALARMAEFHLKQLPLVDGKRFLGLVAEDALLDLNQTDKSLKELPVPVLNYSLQENQHIYEVVKLMSEQQLNIVPVLDQLKKYVGLIDQENLIRAFASLSAVTANGSVLVLEIGSRDNSLAHIAQIVEADHAEILSSYVRSFPNSTRLELTLKLNRTDVASIISAFQRYNYTVLAVFNDSMANEDHSDHYDQLMNYLNL